MFLNCGKEFRKMPRRISEELFSACRTHHCSGLYIVRKRLSKEYLFRNMMLHLIDRHGHDRRCASGATIRHPVTSLRITNKFVYAPVCIGSNVLT